MNPSIDKDLNLKDKIQQKEVEIQTELLRSRKERAKIIKDARMEAKKSISEYQKNLERQYQDWVKELDESTTRILLEVQTKKSTQLKAIDEKWKTEKTQFIDQIIQAVLPETMQSKRSEFID